MDELSSFVLVDYEFGRIIESVINNIISEKTAPVIQALHAYKLACFSDYSQDIDSIINALITNINRSTYNQKDLVTDTISDGYAAINAFFLDDVKSTFLQNLISYHDQNYHSDMDTTLINVTAQLTDSITAVNDNDLDFLAKQLDKGKEIIDQYYNNSVIYVNTTSGVDNTVAQRGRYNLPYKTIQYAINNAPGKATIMLQTSFTVSAIITITKDITIKSADINIAGNRVTSIFSLTRSASYGATTASGDNYHMIRVLATTAAQNGKLTLENVIINGAANETKMFKGSSIFLQGSTSIDKFAVLIMKDNAVLRNAHRQGTGGSAVLMQEYSRFEMYGGEITNNYHKTLTSGVGSNDSANNQYILMGGTVHHNYSASRALLIGKNNIIGGSFSIVDNFEYANKIKPRNFQVGSTLNMQEGFYGKILVTQTDAKRFDRVNVNYDGIEGGLAPYSLVLEHNTDLYAVYDYDKGYYVWDYKYTEYIKIKEPTLIAEGSKNKYAYIGENPQETPSYTVTVPIPKLNATYYDITIDTSYRIITF